MPGLNDEQEVGDNHLATFCAIPDPLHTLQQVNALFRIFDDRLYETRLVPVRNTTQQQNAAQRDVLDSECEVVGRR